MIRGYERSQLIHGPSLISSQYNLLQEFWSIYLKFYCFEMNF